MASSQISTTGTTCARNGQGPHRSRTRRPAASVPVLARQQVAAADLAGYAQLGSSRRRGGTGSAYASRRQDERLVWRYVPHDVHLLHLAGHLIHGLAVAGRGVAAPLPSRRQCPAVRRSRSWRQGRGTGAPALRDRPRQGPGRSCRGSGPSLVGAGRRAATMPGIAGRDDAAGLQPVQAGAHCALGQPGVADQRGHRRERGGALSSAADIGQYVR